MDVMDIWQWMLQVLKSISLLHVRICKTAKKLESG